MYTETDHTSRRMNVAQEVMRFAVEQQVQFLNQFEEAAERAREQKAEEDRKARKGTDPEVIVSVDGKETVEKAEPIKAESSLGVSVDIEA